MTCFKVLTCNYFNLIDKTNHNGKCSIRLSRIYHLTIFKLTLHVYNSLYTYFNVNPKWSVIISYIILGLYLIRND